MGLVLIVGIVGTAIQDLRTARYQSTTAAPSLSRPARQPNVNISAFRGQGQLAFVSGGWLYILDGNTGKLRTVAESGEASTPIWSPSGRWLLFSRDRQAWVVAADGTRAHSLGPLAPVSWSPVADVLAGRAADGLWVFPVEGSPRHVLSASVGFVSWSPDGKTLVYTVPRHESNDALYSVAVEGGSPHEIPLDLSRTRIYDNTTNNGLAIAGWWPDGRGLLLWRYPSHSASIAADGQSLESVPLAGGSVRTLAAVAPGSKLAVSPRRLVVLVVEGLGRIVWQNKTIAACDLQAGECQPFAQPAGTVSLDPAWSPDGARFAFVRADAGSLLPGFGPEAVAAWIRTRTLWIANADGSQTREIMAAGNGVIAPAWSRDHEHILFIRDYSLWLLGLNETTSRRVADGLFGGKQPASYYGQINWQDQVAWFRPK